MKEITWTEYQTIQDKINQGLPAIVELTFISNYRYSEWPARSWQRCKCGHEALWYSNGWHCLTCGRWYLDFPNLISP